MLHNECLTPAINQYRRSIHIGIAQAKPTKIPMVIGLSYNTSRGPLEPDKGQIRSLPSTPDYFMPVPESSSGRSGIFKAFMREARVVGLTPSRRAAPSAP